MVDLMHEFELGVLKNVLKHLIRILYAVDPPNVAQLNERYVEHLRIINISTLDLHDKQILGDTTIWG